MKRRFSCLMAVLIVVGAGVSMGQTKAVTKAVLQAKPAKLPDPVADALQGYLYAQYTYDHDELQKYIEVTVAGRKRYADALTGYLLWSRCLERRAIEKWGKEEGMRVLSHVRSFDDQYVIDSRRVRDAKILYNNDKTAASVHFSIEINRPDNLQVGDAFNFLDSYEMIKVGDTWKLDFLKTYTRVAEEEDDDFKAEMTAFVRMATVISNLCGQLKKDQLKTADAVKQVLDEKWERVYDEPISIHFPTQRPPEPDK